MTRNNEEGRKYPLAVVPNRPRVLWGSFTWLTCDMGYHGICSGVSRNNKYNHTIPKVSTSSWHKKQITSCLIQGFELLISVSQRLHVGPFPRLPCSIKWSTLSQAAYITSAQPVVMPVSKDVSWWDWCYEGTEMLDLYGFVKLRGPSWRFITSLPVLGGLYTI